MKAHPWSLLPLIGLLGCGGDNCGGGPLPPPVEMLVESGAYAAHDAAVPGYPHSGGRDLSLDVDREGGRVTVRYERDGQIVEEIWRITSQEVSVHF